MRLEVLGELKKSTMTELVLGSPFYCECLERWLSDECPHSEPEPESESESYITADGQSASVSGAYDHIFITARQLRVCWCGALSLTRGRVCRLQLLLVLATAFSGPSPVGLATMFYYLRFETSLFIASYDSKGLHMGMPSFLSARLLI
jgi:hypothetical protein